MREFWRSRGAEIFTLNALCERRPNVAWPQRVSNPIITASILFEALTELIVLVMARVR